MRRARSFVKRVNTIYCAFVLGQSQDVDDCGRLWKSRLRLRWVRFESAFRLRASRFGGQAADIPRLGLPSVARRRSRAKDGRWGPSFGPRSAQADAWVGCCFFPRGCEKNEVAGHESNGSATRAEPEKSRNLGQTRSA